MSKSEFYTFLPDGLTFTSRDAARFKAIYAPLCGIDAAGLKSAISPGLAGDIKLDRLHYVTKPASREDLRYPSRDFFIYVQGNPPKVYSLAQESPSDSATVTAGPLWHRLIRAHKGAGIELSAINFIPSTNETVELMRITVKNTGRKSVVFTPTAAIPIFGRSLSNKHDHEHVSALFNRITQNNYGVLLEPSMVFNEEGHKDNGHVYFVYGAAVAGSFPTVDVFYGDGGNMCSPVAVKRNLAPGRLTEKARQGKEAVGALRFKQVSLKPGAEISYVVAIGVARSAEEAARIWARFNTTAKFTAAWERNKKFWAQKISSIRFHTGDQHFNAWMRWVTLQPVLRRIFGCSFLPDHDYGKGGKGWRDLWQDLLSLILIEPQLVRGDLINNCAGIRIDGSNATIIGTGPGEFLADRNAITRVWMDHGAWPFLTLSLYIHQTGDFQILQHKQTYFRDRQLSRTMEKDMDCKGTKLLDKKGRNYEGTILEHVLVQNLTQFFNVGEHNIIRLESADWNDGLDMAFAHGESVAFSSFYAGNLFKMADLLEEWARKQLSGGTIRIAKELLALLDTLGAHPVDYDKPQAKRARLWGVYFPSVQPVLSGDQIDLRVADVAGDLRKKAQWMFDHIRRQEKVMVTRGKKRYQWFNGYYDNNAKKVEGISSAEGTANVRMTLTGQVFAVMSGLARTEDIRQVITSVERFLKDKDLKGTRLNTDFGVRHYMELGRAFGFAYGTKENGSFFSHMNVMYAYALYSRGFVREGHEVLSSIYSMAKDGARSKIYPGIPEYFDSEGRGMYHYLTGSASWLVLTELTQVFGVRGHWGDLVLDPKLVAEQFDQDGRAAITCSFAGHKLTIEFDNPGKLDAGQYSIKEALFGSRKIDFERLSEGGILIKRQTLEESLSGHPKTAFSRLSVILHHESSYSFRRDGHGS